MDHKLFAQYFADFIYPSIVENPIALSTEGLASEITRFIQENNLTDDPISQQVAAWMIVGQATGYKAAYDVMYATLREIMDEFRRLCLKPMPDEDRRSDEFRCFVSYIAWTLLQKFPKSWDEESLNTVFLRLKSPLPQEN